MLAVPWLIGWALKPYIQINDQADATKSEKRLSAAVAKAQLSSLVVDSGSNPTPGGSSASDEPAPQEKLIQATVVSKTAAVKPTHSATAGPSRIPQIVKPQQSESPPESGYTTKVSTHSITLKMSSVSGHKSVPFNTHWKGECAKGARLYWRATPVVLLRVLA